jgi:EAL domain-containing protein (putative c-di-GMP-specific phosphodiesterase class I)
MSAAFSGFAGGAVPQGVLQRLTQEHFAEFPLSEVKPGRVVAQFFQSRLTSAFQPIVRAADAGVAGHHGLLRVYDERGQAVAPWNVFARAADDDQLVRLDRLTRTLHALNYFPAEGNPGALFLNVERRLLAHVAADHGAYFETILAQLGVPTERVTIVLPASAAEDPVTFVRAAISYRIRGYRVLVQLRSAREADLAHVFLADPHYAAIDLVACAPSPRVDAEVDEMRRVVEALARRGINSVARRIQDAEQAEAARDVGFGFLQGWHFAAEGERP